MAGEEIRKELNDILLHEGVVSLDALNDALKEQEKNRAPLIDILIAKDKVNTQKLVLVLSRKYGYPTINPEIFLIDESVISAIPKEIARKYQCLPISRYEKTLTVAFANPTNIKAVDELRAVTGFRIKIAVADAKILKKYVSKYYEAAPAAITEAPAEKVEQLDDLVKMIETEKGAEGQEDTSDLMKVAYETPIIKLVNMILMESIRRRASDIFIEPWERHVRVRARVDGLLEEVIKPPKQAGAAIVSRIKVMSELDISEHRIPQDGRFKIKINGREVDMRVSILPTSFGEKVCMRILDTKSQSHDISKLGFSEDEQQIIRDSARHPHGMMLVTGPTGSGKTTTLYSVLKYLDRPEVNITTCEDPVEYQLSGINQVQIRENFGLTFPAALRSILRQDPNVILIGEIRDQETLDIAVKAALTGHLVLSTLHTNDAASSITRMVNMGLEPFLIASTVLMISAQRLVRRLCQRCRYPEEMTDPASLKKLGLGNVDKAVFYRGKGCGQCRQTGYSGRSVITEILQVTQDIRNLIMQGETAEKIKAYAFTHGMITLRGCAVKKALAGDTSLEEVYRVTSEDQGLEDLEKNEAEEKKAAKLRKIEKAA